MMELRGPLRSLLVLLFVGASGCALNPETGMAGIDGGTGEPNESHVWDSSSDSIEIHWFSFWAGGAKFGKSRAELTEEELSIVETMTIIPPTEDCWSDSGEATVIVTSAGTEHRYMANEYDGTCGRDGTLIDYEPVQALRDLAHCLSAKSYDGSTLATAASIKAGDGCYHGLFNGSSTTPEWWFLLEMPTAGPLHVSLDGCGDRDLELVLFDATGTTSIASATRVAGATCPELVLTVPAPGSYAIRVDMRAGTYAGDFFLRVDSGT